MIFKSLSLVIFFFNDTATTEIYTLSLHDALPICGQEVRAALFIFCNPCFCETAVADLREDFARSEEHTSELQSHLNLVCRLLLEKKKHINFPRLSSPSLILVLQII